MSDAQRDAHRLEIARHAVRLFRTDGVAATTGRDIASAAGVSERTLWRWFRTKEACVEPLLRRAIDAFTAVARTWPAGRDLPEHLEVSYGFSGSRDGSGDSGDGLRDGSGDSGDSRDDVEAVLAVLRMARDEPALRAIWLLLSERAEPALAEVLAARTGLPADGLEIRVRAAAMNAALRVATEELAWSAVDGLTDAIAARYRVRLAEALRLATPS